jgi:steroid delta-isomerase-like uncharacterized protein
MVTITDTQSHLMKDAINAACQRWNAGDLPGYLRLYSPNAVLHGPPGIEPGFEAIKAFYEDFWTAFKGSQLVFEDVFTSDDRLACRFVVHGRHTGPFQGIPATGRSFTVPGITILRFSNGLCEERWNQADFLSLLTQLGALPG